MATGSTLSTWLERLGWTERSPERSVWLIGDDAGAAARLAGALRLKAPRIAIPVTGPGANGPRPAPVRPALYLTLRRLRARAVVVIGDRPPLSRVALAAAGGMGAVPLQWSGHGAPPDDLVIALAEAVRANPRARRLAPWARRLGERTLSRGLPGGIDRLRLRKLNTVDAVSDLLGHPRTILCLGNGPSAETQEASAAARRADAVFRVNYRWRGRSAVQRADAVFSGTPEAAARVPKALFIARDHEGAVRLALERLWRGGFRATRFAVLEEIVPGAFNRFQVPVRPSNGAAMLALAAALNPERLTVAGVDLSNIQTGPMRATPTVRTRSRQRTIRRRKKPIFALSFNSSETAPRSSDRAPICW